MAFQTISYEIPVEIKIAIADVLINFARMESAAEALICLLADHPGPDAEPPTPIDARQKLAVAEVLVERHLSDIASYLLPDDFWTKARELCDSRDQITRGYWLMADKALAVAASLRLRSQDTLPSGERFTVERLNAIARECDMGRSYLGGLIDVRRNG